MSFLLRHPLVWLFGGWVRTGNVHGSQFYFAALRKYRLEQYSHTGLGAIDPYGKFLTGPVTFVPGRLLRRRVRTL